MVVIQQCVGIFDLRLELPYWSGGGSRGFLRRYDRR